MHDRSGPILQQWKDLEPEFPQMSMVARDILAVPAAGVGCERVFSVAGALYDHRKNFHPDTFSAMMMVRFYDQKENADASLHLDLEEEESMSLEDLTNEMQRRHEDITQVFQKVYIRDEEDDNNDEDQLTQIGSSQVEQVSARDVSIDSLTFVSS